MVVHVRVLGDSEREQGRDRSPGVGPAVRKGGKFLVHSTTLGLRVRARVYCHVCARARGSGLTRYVRDKLMVGFSGT